MIATTTGERGIRVSPQSVAIPRYVALPEEVLTRRISPAAVAVFLGILAEFSRSGLPVLEILSSGRRPFIVGDSLPRLRERVATRCGLGVRVVARELGVLARLGLVGLTTASSRRARLELTGTAYGWPDEDLERRRLARAGQLKRRYVAVPLDAIGRWNASEIGVLVRVLAACGVGLHERAQAGETIAVALGEGDIARELGISARTVRRALDRFEAGGLLSRLNLGRGGISITVGPRAIGYADEQCVDAAGFGTIPADATENQDISAAALAHARSVSKEREETAREEAARGLTPTRFASVYRALSMLCASNGNTTPALRARMRRAALSLALDDAPAEHVLGAGRALVCENGHAPPERIAECVLEDLRSRRCREASEARFRVRSTSLPSASTTFEASGASDGASIPPMRRDATELEALAEKLARAVTREGEVAALLLAQGIPEVDRDGVMARWHALRAEREHATTVPQKAVFVTSADEQCSVADGLAIVRTALGAKRIA